MTTMKNETGKTYGQLFVISFAGSKKRVVYWKAKCSCGNVSKYRGAELRRGKAFRCRKCADNCKPKIDAARRNLRNIYNVKYPFNKICGGWLSRCFMIYRLRPSDWTHLVLESSGRCSICSHDFKESRDCHIDHDHKTSTVRGLLCMNCNKNLAVIEDDLYNVLARNYLDAHSRKSNGDSKVLGNRDFALQART